MDAIPGRRWSHDRHYVSAARNDVESAARDVGPGTRWPGAEQLLWRCSSEMAYALEIDDSNRILCRRNGRLYPIEHSRGNDQHRNSVRLCDRLRRGVGDADDQSQCESPLPRAIRSAGSNPRNRYLPVADVLVALRELGPSYRLAGGWTGDLLCVWPPSQRDGTPYGA